MANSYDALLKESQLTINALESTATLESQIKNGQWDKVIATVSSMKLPMAITIDLYEQVVMELVEDAEMDLARNILLNTPPMILLKQTQSDRYIKLEELLTSSIHTTVGFIPCSPTHSRYSMATSNSVEMTWQLQSSKRYP